MGANSKRRAWLLSSKLSEVLGLGCFPRPGQLTAVVITLLTNIFPTCSEHTRPYSYSSCVHHNSRLLLTPLSAPNCHTLDCQHSLANTFSLSRWNCIHLQQKPGDLYHRLHFSLCPQLTVLQHFLASLPQSLNSCSVTGFYPEQQMLKHQ